MNDDQDAVKTVEWTANGVVLIDQRALPTREEYVVCRTYEEVAESIRAMVVRGAPAIGVTAAMGIALGLKQCRATNQQDLKAEFDAICRTLAETRPTAVNLFWAIGKMKTRFDSLLAGGSSREAIAKELESLAQQICTEDVASCKRLGDFGASLVPDGKTVMTVCNAGALATAGYGTALGVIRSAVRAGRNIDVMALETRPFLQGARLTAWELSKDHIPTTLITDNMSGHFLKTGAIGCVVVGADRIAGNGDTANKIGTYTVAVLARENNVPFYVAAPFSTVDLAIPGGEQIPIEERAITEVTRIQNVQIAPDGVAVRNPAFDVTPHRFINAIITDRGIAEPPYNESLPGLKASG